MIQDRATQICVTQVRLGEPRVGEIRAHQISRFEIRCGKVCKAKAGAIKLDASSLLSH